jgi:hypothetical protein
MGSRGCTGRPTIASSGSREPPANTSSPGSSWPRWAEHQYLQELVKRWAEAKGYRPTVEEPLPSGDKRGIVQAIVERVTVGKDEIEISLSYLPRTPPPPSPPPLKIVATDPHNPRVALPFCRLILRAALPSLKPPQEPRTAGEHL